VDAPVTKMVFIVVFMRFAFSSCWSWLFYAFPLDDGTMAGRDSGDV
jgi:hypothetical protein